MLQQTTSHTRRRRFVVRFFLSYVAILFIPFWLVAFTYNRSASLIIRQSEAQVRGALQQTSGVTDARLREMKSISLSLKTNESVLSFYQKWLSTDDSVFAAYRANHQIPQYSLTNSAVDKIEVIFARPEECFVLSNGAGMLYDDSLMEATYEDSSITFRELNAFLLSDYYYDRFLILPSGIYFLSNINAFYQQECAGVIMIRLSNVFFTEMLSRILPEGEGTALIVDEEGEVVSCVLGRDARQLDEAEMEELFGQAASSDAESFLFHGQEVSRVRSELNGWVYYSLIPRALVLADLYQVRHVIIIVTVAALVLGILLCYLLTMRHSKPLRRIIQSLTSVYDAGIFDSEDDFHFIESAVTDLLSEKASSQELLDQEVLRRLFLFEDIGSASFAKKLGRSSLPDNPACLYTVYLHVHGTLSAAELDSIEEQVATEAELRLFRLSIDPTNLVWLLETADSPKHVLEEIGHEVTSCHIDFFISDPVSDYPGVSAGYEFCKKLALAVVKQKSQHAYSSDDLQTSQPFYHYSMNQELQLVQLIRYGSREKLRDLSDEIYQQNYVAVDLSEGMQQSLLSAIRASLIRHLSDYGITDIPAFSFEIDSADTLFAILEGLQAEVQSQILHNALSETDTLNQRILDYINANYGNASLNLSLLCEDLNISEQTAVKLFQGLGSSFHTFLEQVRIDAACTLLLKKDLTVKDISGQVGYTSDASFRRAFKRVLGVSPSDFVKGQE